MRRTPRPLALVALLAVLVVAPLVTPPAVADVPDISGIPVRVDPASNLFDGRPVHLSASGLPADHIFDVVECDVLVSDPEQGGCPAIGSATSDATGAVSTTMRVRGYVVRAQEFGDGVPVYCRADQCRLFLATTDDAGDYVGASSVPLRFRGSPATLEVRPSSDLPRHRRVYVTGTAYGAEGRLVSLVQAFCVNLVQGAGCTELRPEQLVRVGADGRFAGRYVVASTAHGYDCHDWFGDCRITATVLDRRGEPDDTFGDADHFGDPGVSLNFRP